MTPRIGLLLFTALLMQCENPVETPVPGKETVPAQIRQTDCFNGGNALFHAARITEMGNRASGTPGYRRQMDYLKEELAKCGWTCREQAFEKETPQGPVRFVNLRARFGKAPNFLDPVRGLLTCHIDTKRGIDGFTGANDGASGAAAILETARILSGDPARAGNLELVFFDGEESFAEHMDSDDGLYGSRHYASSMRQPLPEWMINLDMVGRQGKKIRIPAMTPQSMYRVYSRAIRELGYSPEEWGVSGYAILDDHVPFMERGVDTLNLIDDFQDGNWWHTSKDNIGILGEKSFQQTGEMTLHILRQLRPGPPSTDQAALTLHLSLSRHVLQLSLAAVGSLCSLRSHHHPPGQPVAAPFRPLGGHGIPSPCGQGNTWNEKTVALSDSGAARDGRGGTGNGLCAAPARKLFRLGELRIE